MVERVNKLLRFFGRHEPDVNALSAYLDGRLATPEAARLRAHLASCEACRARLDGLRATRDTLRAMLDVDPPRSFRVRAADAEGASATALPRPARTLRWAPAMSAAAAVVFAIVLVMDITSSGSGSSATRAPLAASQRSTSAESSGAADKSAADAGAPAPQTRGSSAAQSTLEAGIAAPGDATAAPGETPETVRELAPEDAAAPTEPSSALTEAYDATAAAAAPGRIAGPDTAENGSPAEAVEHAPEDGNNTAALRVIEIIAGAIAVASAAVGIRWWRTGRGRLS